MCFSIEKKIIGHTSVYSITRKTLTEYCTRMRNLGGHFTQWSKPQGRHHHLQGGYDGAVKSVGLSASLADLCVWGWHTFFPTFTSQLYYFMALNYLRAWGVAVLSSTIVPKFDGDVHILSCVLRSYSAPWWTLGVRIERQNAQCVTGEYQEPGLAFQPHLKQLCFLLFVLCCCCGYVFL